MQNSKLFVILHFEFLILVRISCGMVKICIFFMEMFENKKNDYIFAGTINVGW